MDTNVNKPRQGASADLSQQEPHIEVVEKNLRYFFRGGEIGCRHLHYWTANQETLWSTTEETQERKEDEGGDLDG
jgi:hypothetical protein